MSHMFTGFHENWAVYIYYKYGMEALIFEMEYRKKEIKKEIEESMNMYFPGIFYLVKKEQKKPIIYKILKKKCFFVFFKMLSYD